MGAGDNTLSEGWQGTSKWWTRCRNSRVKENRMAHFSVRFKAFDRDCLLRARSQLQTALSLCQPSKTSQPAEQEPDTPQEEQTSTPGPKDSPHYIAGLLGPHAKVCMHGRRLKYIFIILLLPSVTHIILPLIKAFRIELIPSTTHRRASSTCQPQGVNSPS